MLAGRASGLRARLARRSRRSSTTLSSGTDSPRVLAGWLLGQLLRWEATNPCTLAESWPGGLPPARVGPLLAVLDPLRISEIGLFLVHIETLHL